MDEERTELVILLETIKENIMRNPGKGIWIGIIICNGKEYHWKVTEKPLDFLVKEKQ
jgi:hypothetical protein